MKGKPYLTGGQAYGTPLIIVALKEPACTEGPRLYFEKEAKTYPKLTDLARKGRVKRRQKKGCR